MNTVTSLATSATIPVRIVQETQCASPRVQTLRRKLAASIVVAPKRKCHVLAVDMRWALVNTFVQNSSTTSTDSPQPGRPGCIRS